MIKHQDAMSLHREIRFFKKIIKINKALLYVIQIADHELELWLSKYLGES